MTEKNLVADLDGINWGVFNLNMLCNIMLMEAHSAVERTSADEFREIPMYILLRFEQLIKDINDFQAITNRALQEEQDGQTKGF